MRELAKAAWSFSGLLAWTCLWTFSSSASFDPANTGKIFSTLIEPTKNTCSDASDTNSYFDTSSFSCISCGANQESLTSFFKTCKCLPSKKRAANPDPNLDYYVNQGCTDCEAVGSSSFSSGCRENDYANCEGGTTLMKLPRNTDLSGLYCLPCQYGIWSGFPCKCKTGELSVYPNHCFTANSRWNTVGSWKPYTKDASDMTSSYFRCNLPRAIELCNKGEKKGCSHLANLCVLSEFNRDKPACAAFFEIQDTLAKEVDASTSPGWKEGLPFLQYSTNVKSEDLTRNYKNINLVTVMDPEVNTATEASILPFYLAMYEIDGKYAGFKKLDNELLLCTTKHVEVAQSQMFGVAFNMSCELPVNEFLNSPGNTLLYELYLKDGDKYVPVPIATNYLNSGVSRDDLNAGKNLKLTNRFFIIDKTTGIQTTKNDLFSQSYTPDHGEVFGPSFHLRECEQIGAMKPTFIRYIKSITFYLDSFSDPLERITRPFFYFEYDMVSLTSAGTSKITYQSVFNNELHGFDTACIVLIIFAIIIALIISAVRIWIWTKLYPNKPEVKNRTMKLIWAIIDIVLETFGLVLYVYLLIMTFVVYSFFKWQKGVTLLLPNEYFYPYRYTNFYVLFGFVCACVLISNVIGLLRQSFYDIFFIDWEKRRFFSKRGNRTTLVQSVWRTLLVGNQYNELTTIRWVFIDFTIIFTGFWLVGVGWEAYSASAPYFFYDVDHINDSRVLKFSLDNLIMLIIVLRRLLSRFFPTTVENLVDLCSIANISMIFFDAPFHGYYIHGMNPTFSGKSDTNIKGLMDAIEMESRSQDPKPRGLEKGSFEQKLLQTYEIFVPPRIREEYNAVLEASKKVSTDLKSSGKKDKSSKKKNTAINNPGDNREGSLSDRTMNNDKIGLKGTIGKDDDKLRAEYKHQELSELEHLKAKVTQEFRNMIKNAMDSKNTVIRDKTWEQNLFGIPPDDSIAVKDTIFFRDYDSGFKRSSLIGLDIRLLCGQALFFYLMHIIFLDTSLALFLTFLWDGLLRFIRSYYGEDNISKKTMIDERFLI